MNNVVILAAGLGSRMKSSKPKCLHELIEKPMIKYVIDACASIDNINIVVGHSKEQVISTLGDKYSYFTQDEQLGTAHSVMQANKLSNIKGNTLVINCDLPLITRETIDLLLKQHMETNSDMTLVTSIVDDPTGYGRIISDNGSVSKIVEEKDTSASEKLISEINVGVYCFDNELLFKMLEKVDNNNAQEEYYLTDLVHLFNENNYVVRNYILANKDEAFGINDKYQLSIAEEKLRISIVKKHLYNGVSISNIDTVTIGPDVKIGSDTKIYPNTFIGGKTDIGSNCAIGPFARIRDNAEIGDGVKIGNFVEVKNSKIGDETMISHHVYVGDSSIGERVNIGCGVITVNYDGKNKHKTVIENDCFIGCNVNLVAPVKIGKGTIIAAGTTVTVDSDEDDFVIGRSKEIVKKGYAKKYN